MDQVVMLIRYLMLLIGFLVLVEYVFFSAPEFFKKVFGPVELIGYFGFLLGVGGWVWVGYGFVHRDSFTQGEIVSALLVFWGGMIGAMLIGHKRREPKDTISQRQNAATPSSTSPDI
jgi:hypothetical protein